MTIICKKRKSLAQNKISKTYLTHSVSGMMHPDVVLVVEKHESHISLLKRINDKKIFDTYGMIDAYDIYLLSDNERYDFDGLMEVRIKMNSSLDHSSMQLI